MTSIDQQFELSLVSHKIIFLFFLIRWTKITKVSQNLSFFRKYWGFSKKKVIIWYIRFSLINRIFNFPFGFLNIAVSTKSGVKISLIIFFRKLTTLTSEAYLKTLGNLFPMIIHKLYIELSIAHFITWRSTHTTPPPPTPGWIYPT